jgi:hypothetical protein
MYSDSTFEKLKWSLPWLSRYPFWRVGEFMSRPKSSSQPQDVIILVANHFEPGVGQEGLRLLKKWYTLARETGEAVRDHDGTMFRHTNFVPAEQYDSDVMDMLASMQDEGLGEVEVHFHHGVEKPDTAENTRRVLTDFRDVLADKHRCLSRETPDSQPQYAFVHGNWALANSAGGRYCGVDSEMQILADTGCYADFTLPSAPDESQVAKINSLYRCGNPLTEQKPHRSGPDLAVGDEPGKPMMFTGPLIFDWSRRKKGLPVPRIDDGSLAENYPSDLRRFDRWRNARISVKGGPEWVFIKLYSHAFFEHDQDAMIGEKARRFLSQVLEHGERTGEYRVHFASAREAYNIVLAALEGHSGNPHAYRDFRLRPIMNERSRANTEWETEGRLVTST